MFVGQYLIKQCSGHYYDRFDGSGSIWLYLPVHKLNHRTGVIEVNHFDDITKAIAEEATAGSDNKLIHLI